MGYPECRFVGRVVEDESSSERRRFSSFFSSGAAKINRPLFNEADAHEHGLMHAINEERRMPESTRSVAHVPRLEERVAG